MVYHHRVEPDDSGNCTAIPRAGRDCEPRRDGPARAATRLLQIAGVRFAPHVRSSQKRAGRDCEPRPRTCALRRPSVCFRFLQGRNLNTRSIASSLTLFARLRSPCVQIVPAGSLRSPVRCLRKSEIFGMTKELALSNHTGRARFEHDRKTVTRFARAATSERSNPAGSVCTAHELFAVQNGPGAI